MSVLSRLQRFLPSQQSSKSNGDGNVGFGPPPEEEELEGGPPPVGDSTTDEEREIMDKWRNERIKPAVEYWRPFFAKIEEANAYYEDDSWCSINPNTNQLVYAPQNESVVGAIPSVPYRSLNYTAIMVDAIVARILSERPMPLAEAGRGGFIGQKNKQIARIANRAMRHVEHFNDGEIENQEIALLKTLGGWAWKKAWYDKTKSGWQKMQDGSLKESQTGEVVYTAVSPLEVLVQPARQFKFVNWMVHCYTQSIGDLTDEYANAQYLTGDHNEDEHVSSKADRQMGAVLSTADRASKMVDVFECYQRKIERETGKEVWWRFIFAEGVTIDPPKSIGECPYTLYLFNRSRKHCLGNTLVFDLLPTQREINQTLSGQAYRRRLHQHIKAVLPRGMLAEVEWDNSSEPIEVDRDNSGQLVKIYYTDPPSMDAQGIDSWLNLQVRIMQDRAGIHETSMGVRDPGITSGIQAQIATGQDSSNLQRPIANFRHSEQKFWLSILRVVDRYFPAGKLLEVAGEDEELAVEVFEKGLINGVSNVRVRSMSRIPMEPAQKQEFILKLAELGVFAPGMEPVKKAIFEFLEFDDSIEEEIDEIQAARDTAIKECELLDAGEIVPVGNYEMFEVHLRVHIQRVNKHDFLRLTENGQLANIEHIEATRKVMAIRSADDMQLAMEAQGGQQASASPVDGQPSEEGPAIEKENGNGRRNGGSGGGNGRSGKS